MNTGHPLGNQQHNSTKVGTTVRYSWKVVTQYYFYIINIFYTKSSIKIVISKRVFHKIINFQVSYYTLPNIAPSGSLVTNNNISNIKVPPPIHFWIALLICPCTKDINRKVSHWRTKRRRGVGVVMSGIWEHFCD